MGDMYHALRSRENSEREKLMFDIISIKEKGFIKKLYKLSLVFRVPVLLLTGPDF